MNAWTVSVENMMTKIIYDKWENGSLVKHEITEDKNGNPTWRMIDSWAGLTDDEIKDIDKSIDPKINIGKGKLLFARAIEQSLKEKNYG